MADAAGCIETVSGVDGSRGGEAEVATVGLVALGMLLAMLAVGGVVVASDSLGGLTIGGVVEATHEPLIFDSREGPVMTSCLWTCIACTRRRSRALALSTARCRGRSTIKRLDRMTISIGPS